MYLEHAIEEVVWFHILEEDETSLDIHPRFRRESSCIHLRAGTGPGPPAAEVFETPLIAGRESKQSEEGAPGRRSCRM